MTAPPDQPHRFDLPDAAELRRRGSMKWTAVSADIAAWVAESDFPTAPAITAALHGAVDAGAFGYLPPAVRQDMAGACAEWHAARYGWQVDPRWIKPVGDVLEALQVAVEHYSRPGSPVILPTPAYMPFVTAPQVWGREVLQVPLTEVDGRPAMDLAALDRAFRAGGHLLVLVNPHNPTGRVLDRAELESVAELVERHGGRVFSDEIHAPLTYDAPHVPYASLSAATAGHTITATSASKAWDVPGLKCAQVLLTNEADAAAWDGQDQLLTKGASTLGAVAAAAAYRDGRSWLDEVLTHLDGNRRALSEVLGREAPTVGYRQPEGTYLAWLDLRSALGTEADPAARSDLADWVRRRTRVAVTDGAACGAAGRGFVRLNLAMPRPMVVEAAARLGRVLAAG